jgi:hypothetical protein
MSSEQPTVEIEAHHLDGGSELYKLAAGEGREFATSTTRFVVRALEADEQGHYIAQQPLARVDDRYVPAEEHPDREVVVQEGELYQPQSADEEADR